MFNNTRHYFIISLKSLNDLKLFYTAHYTYLYVCVYANFHTKHSLMTSQSPVTSHCANPTYEFRHDVMAVADLQVVGIARVAVPGDRDVEGRDVEHNLFPVRR